MGQNDRLITTDTLAFERIFRPFHPGYAVSQRIRKRIEEGFGWGKEFGLLRRIRVRGCESVDMAFAFSVAACNLIRLPKLLAEPKVA